MNDFTTDIINVRRILFKNPWRVLCNQKFGLDKSCETLLSVESFEDVVNDSSKSQHWIRVAEVLLPFIDKENFKTSFTKLLKNILNNESLVGRDEFLENVWKNAEHLNKHIGVFVIEEFIRKVPKYIELNVVRTFGTILRDDRNLTVTDMCDILNSECSLLTKWCTESVVIFSTVSSIMNEILLKFKDKRFLKCLYIIKSFIYNLLKACSKNGKALIDLYPQQYHNLIVLLNCYNLVGWESEIIEYSQDKYNNVINGICLIIQKVLEESPEVILILLSHQLPWNIQ